jgi:hypothetical protein
MMHTNWQVAKHNCHKDPIPHIYCKNFIKLEIYDRLYEQWNNKEHERWNEFIDQNRVDVHFHEDFVRPLNPKHDTGYIGYWFFRQRTDKSSAEDIIVSNGKQEKTLTYYQNTLLVLDVHNSFVVKPRRDRLPTRPFCEMYFSKDTNFVIDSMIK